MKPPSNGRQGLEYVYEVLKNLLKNEASLKILIFKSKSGFIRLSSLKIP